MFIYLYLCKYKIYMNNIYLYICTSMYTCKYVNNSICKYVIHVSFYKHINASICVYVNLHIGIYMQIINIKRVYIFVYICIYICV